MSEAKELAAKQKKVRTDPGRMSHPHILRPRTEKDEETGIEKTSYQLGLLLPPGTDLQKYKDALKAAMVFKFGPDTSNWPKLKRKPSDVIKNFAEYNAERDKPLPGDWTGWTLIRANADVKHPPNVVGPTKGPDGKFPRITDEREVYGGRWGRATLDAFFYDSKKGGKGVTFGLNNVQVLKHDTNFGGAVSAAEDDFDDASQDWAGDDNWGDDAPAKGETAASKNSDGDDWN
jgi:Protein of unknown function (DUF2815)